MFYRIFFTLITFLCALLPVLGQEYSLNFERISAKDGLPHTTVYSIRQDATGFMWFGTENGLVRFDGQQLKVWQADPDNPNGLSGSNISCVDIDSKGNLILGLWGEGLNLFNPVRNTFTHFRNDPADPASLNDNRTQVVFSDSKNRIWAGTYRGGLNRFLEDEGKFLHYVNIPGQNSTISSNRVWSISEAPDGNLWIGTEDGLNRFNPETGKFDRFFTSGNSPELVKGHQIRFIYPDKAGTLWLGTDYGLYLFNPSTNKIKRFLKEDGPGSVSDNIINSILEDASGNIWIATYNRGLLRYLPDKEMFISYTADPKNPNALSGNDIRTIFQDRSGTIWTGGRSSSIARFNLIAKKFNYISNNPNNPNSLSDNDVTAIHQSSDGNLWIGTNGFGLNEYDQTNDRFRFYTTKNSSLGSNNIQTVYAAPDYVWIGTRNGGLNRLDRKTGKITVYASNRNLAHSFSNNTIRAILLDKPGFLWIGTKSAGLYLMDIKKEKLKPVQNDPMNPNSLSGNDIRCLLRSRDGTLWIGTDGGGLNRFNAKDSTFTCWKNTPGKPNSLTNDDVVCLWEDSEGFLWVGTDGGGLNRFNPKTGNFEAISKQAGIAGNIIYGLLGDDKGNLWIQTFNGISRLNLETRSVRNYSVNDGLQSSMFNQNACFRSSSGELFFGGINGITSLFPGQIKDNTFIPAVVLTSFKIFNKEVETDSSVSYLKTIKLDYKDNFFSVEFAALDFVNPKNNQFKYKLEGFDKNWIESGTRNYASYTNLDGGKYVLKILGSNNDGTWNPDGISVNLEVVPPFWQTWWFKVFGLLFLASAIWLAFSLRVKLIRDHNRNLEADIFRRTHELSEKNAVLENTLSDLKAAQAQLFQQEKMASLGTLVAGVAHEINNPVNFIHTSVHPLHRDFAELQKTLREFMELHNELAFLKTGGKKDEILKLIDKLGDEERISHVIELESEIEILLKGIETGSNRTAEIVKSLRTFTRLDENIWKQFNIHDGLDSTIQILTPKWKNKIKIEKEYGDIPEIECFPGQINQVFMNLLVNAIEAIPNEGEITIKTVQTGSTVEIRFSDNGCGISKEEQTRIFEPFFTTKPVGKGTGLGLAISYNVITKHNGTIRVESTPGKGTLFVISLPVIQSPVALTPGETNSISS